MSNQYSGDQSGQPGNNGQFPGQIPPPPEVNQFSGQTPPQPAQKRTKPMALLAMIIVAALVVIGGGAYAITRILFPSGGYSTPDDLAASIENAFDTKSLESLASALPPSELAAATAWQQDYKADGGTD